ncbi:uracil-DNA glycosylase family protein [Pigmentiphaga soli]|uniref:Uracil-DNA glycosylase family protein n=1 Tax=Pigmentiphaga soli TaxID=1007095 RepID=A0ABP8H254_9BURK
MTPKSETCTAGLVVPDDDAPLQAYVDAIRACRVCRDRPRHGQALAHEPRPVIQVSSTATICIAGQAPGIRVHESGRPFNDPSGARLRRWMDVGEDDFYDASRVAIVPMGFCFPGWRPGGSDLPPRPECQEIWRAKLFARLPGLTLLLAIGGHAQKWHLGPAMARQGVTETVRSWRALRQRDSSLRVYPLPHPSWHNNHWLKQNPWFEAEVLPALRADVRAALAGSGRKGRAGGA